MALAMKHIHDRKILHRDLKPENVLMDLDGYIKLADFGFAAPTMGKDGSGYLKTFLGTFLYMAPEIHAKQPYEGKKVDIFALGVVLFILLTGHRPFG